VFGLARNRRLEAALVDQLAEAKRLCAASGRPARVFRDFRYCVSACNFDPLSWGIGVQN
jgi:hypothetical protein